MELTLTSVLSLFSLLALASGVYFAAKRFKVPYTVLLVLVGLALVPIATLPVLEPVFGFIDDMVLTPELLFFIFLPILIFESAFNMNVRKLLESSWSILLLAIGGMIVSTLLIASGIYWILPLIGLEVPFILALLFGAIISSTDPVAVLALFKEFGAPKRLTMIFEGESLFNDGTAVALFMVLLAVATNGFSGAETVVEGTLTFVGMVIFGILLGLLAAAVFSRAMRATRSNEFVTVTLLLISAHVTFIIGEAINHYGLFGLNIHVSSIIATTIAALFLGNYSRHTLTSRTDEYASKLVEHLAFVTNSLVFLLAGLLFATSGVDFGQLWLPILVTVVIVAIVRAISVYLATTPVKLLKLEKIPNSWQVLLAWGSLRGALAIIIVMTIPDDFAIAGWEYAYSPKELLLALTIGCILATLFIKAPLIGPLVRKLKLNAPDPLELAQEADLEIYRLLTEKSRLEIHKTKGFVQGKEYDDLKKEVEIELNEARATRDKLVKKYGRKVFDRSLHLMTISVEVFTLKQVYQNREISEKQFRRIMSKLNLQREKIEYARQDEIDPSHYTDRKDVFDRLVNFMQTVFTRRKSDSDITERLQYYRSQMILARKSVKALKLTQTEFGEPVFLPESFEAVMAKYDTYRQQAIAKVDKLVADNESELAPYLSWLARRSLDASGKRAAATLHHRGIVGELES